MAFEQDQVVQEKKKKKKSGTRKKKRKNEKEKKTKKKPSCSTWNSSQNLLKTHVTPRPSYDQPRGGGRGRKKPWKYARKLKWRGES